MTPLDKALVACPEERKARDEATVEEARKMGKLPRWSRPLATSLRDEAFSHAPPDKMKTVGDEMAMAE